MGDENALEGFDLEYKMTPGLIALYRVYINGRNDAIEHVIHGEDIGLSDGFVETLGMDIGEERKMALSELMDDLSLTEKYVEGHYSPRDVAKIVHGRIEDEHGDVPWVEVRDAVYELLDDEGSRVEEEV